MRRDRVQRTSTLRSTLASALNVGVLTAGLVGCEKNNDTVSLIRDATDQADSRASDTSGETPGDDVAEAEVTPDEPDTVVADTDSPADTTGVGDVELADAAITEDATLTEDALDPDAVDPDALELTDLGSSDLVGDEDTVSPVDDVSSAHDASTDDVSVADADGACTGPTCVGADWPAWTLTDLNPSSATYNQPYTQPGFIGKATMLAILRSG